MEGTFAIRDGMNPNGSHLISFSLTTKIEEGQSNTYQLEFDTLPNNIKDLSGKHVIVQGYFENNDPLGKSANTQFLESSNNSPIFNTHTIHSYGENTAKLDSAVSSQALSGTANIVTLLVKFSDDLQEMHTQDYFQNRFYDAPDSLDEFMRTSSYDQFAINGTAKDWVTLPLPTSSYNSGGFVLFEKIVNDAVIAHGIPASEFPNIDGLIIVTNNCYSPSCSANGDIQPVPYPIAGVGTLTTAVSWLPDQTNDFWCCALGLDNGLGVPGHELGHNLGFEHTPPSPGNWINAGGCFVNPCNDPYHDPWSIMSANTDFVGPSALIMGQRDQASWITEDNKETISDGTSATITLDYINEAQNGNNPQMGQIPLSDGTKYVFEAHKDELFNDTPDNNEGILLYRYFPTGNQYPYLTFGQGYDKSAQYSLVTTSGADLQSDFKTANLDVGEIWVDEINNVLVETISKNSTTVTVSISNNIPMCSPPVSGVWIITSSCTLPASTIINGNVIIQNNSLLTISNGVTLTITSGNSITIEVGSGLLIQSGTLMVNS